jgi:hypothetical protein
VAYYRDLLTSCDKMRHLGKLCDAMGVHTGPAVIHTPRGRKLLIAPLLSWYHASWDTRPDPPTETLDSLCRERGAMSERWMDFHLCKWPLKLVRRQDFVSTTTASTALADAFSALNEPLFAHPLASGEGRKQEDVVISFSHFVPRQELCPEKHQLNDPMLPKVRGFGDWLATPRLSDVRGLWLKYSKTAHWKLERS